MKHKHTIVAIDDDANILHVLELGLGKLYRIVPVSDSVKAVETVTKEKPDLILLDMRMPVLSGIDVLREMKKAGLKHNIIMLTSQTDMDLVRQSFEFGASEYISKPFKISELTAIIDTKLTPRSDTPGADAPPWRIK